MAQKNLGIRTAGLSITKRAPQIAQGKALDNFFAGGHMLCDGAMGTMLLEHSDLAGRCCDELNLSHPDRVASVHADYLRAGAQIIETNTFGSNAFRLDQYGLRHKLREINLAAVRIAKESAKQSAHNAYVAGVVGPLGVALHPDSAANIRQAQAAFAGQISALTYHAASVDLLIIETMMSLAEAAAAIRAARDVAPQIRLIVMMTVDQCGDCLDGASPETAAARLAELGADAIGCNCSHGPASVLSAIEQMRAVTQLPLAAMPNAGLPVIVKGRNLYEFSPEDMATYTRQIDQRRSQSNRRLLRHHAKTHRGNGCRAT